MLELYHGGHTTCSRKARLCLREKGLAYTSHFLNLRGFEQHTPAYLKLNPNGVVPTLIDDGEVVVDSMLTNEYLVKWYLFWDALSRNRTDGAMLRLITPINTTEPVDQADARIVAFAQAIAPRLSAFIPQ